jgi:hypothetical protein
MPVDLQPIRANDHRRWGYVNIEFFIDFFSYWVRAVGPEEDKMFVEKILIFGIFEELLTQQFARPSAV